MTDTAMADERELLLSSLTNQREHVLDILEGLSEDDLRRPLLPTGWTCLGLVRHLALDVERFWFSTVVAALTIDSDGTSDADAAAAPDTDGWQVPAGVPAEAVFALYRRTIEEANAVIATTALDAGPAGWPDDEWPDWRMETFREIILHVITETACHAGHLDIVRELIDGRTRLILTD